MVRENFYVDDLLTGADTPEELSNIRTELTSLLKLGGFPITKWKTNGQFHESIEFTDPDKEQSVLGLCWNLATDQFFFKIRGQEEENTVWTKRKILSMVGKMYNPNGYLGPVIINDIWTICRKGFFEIVDSNRDTKKIKVVKKNNFYKK